MYKIIRKPFGDTPVNFVGVHPVKWHEHPPQPDVAFVEVEESDRVRELEAELRETRAKVGDLKLVILELTKYLQRVTDYRLVDINEMDEFVANVKKIHGIREASDDH